MVYSISSTEFREAVKSVPEFYLHKSKYYLPTGQFHFYEKVSHYVNGLQYEFAKVCIKRHKYIYIKFPMLDCCQHPLGIQGVICQYVLTHDLYV